MKPRLFICGDSWTDWPLPPSPFHWIDYLEDDYEITRLGLRGCSNYDIFSQIGNIPTFRKGDRLVVIWTSPFRVRNLVEPVPSTGNKRGLKWYERLTLPSINFDPIRAKRLELWRNPKSRYFEGEVTFIKKIKTKMVKEYRPLFYTWDQEFWDKTSDFFTLLTDIETLHETYPDKSTLNDNHPSEDGCYKIYKKVHKDLKIGTLAKPQQNKILH